MKKNEFRCGHCSNIYEKDWTDEEAIKESNEMFGDCNKNDLAIICDNCYKKLFPVN